jgi:hypothetical protein
VPRDPSLVLGATKKDRSEWEPPTVFSRGTPGAEGSLTSFGMTLHEETPRRKGGSGDKKGARGDKKGARGESGLVQKHFSNGLKILLDY